MTVTALPVRDEYTATAGQTVFNYTFLIFTNQDLNVYITPSGQAASDSADLTTAYTIDVGTIGNPVGGFITLDSGTGSGDLVTIVSNIVDNRTTEYQNSGDFLPDTVNEDFDRVVSLTKQIADTAGRTPAYQESEQNTSGQTLDAPTALGFWRDKSDESGVEKIDLTTTGSPTDASVITYNPPFVGGSARSQEDKNTDYIHAKDFGAVADGVTNNLVAFRAIAAALTDNTKVHFSSGIYLLAYTGGFTSVNGEVALLIKDVKNIELSGDQCTIKIVNHDIAANGGFSVLTWDGVQNLDVHGFTFDLSYTGRNDSASFYPFNGAMWGIDTSGVAGSRTGDQLSSDIKCHDNIYNIYHPSGAYGEALNPDGGDPNNGFKVFSCTAFGDRLATAFDNQNSVVSFYNNTFLSTHNAYGIWVWAYNAVEAWNNKGLEWANYATDSSNVTNGGSIPMVRYHQFYCTGVDVHDNQMSPRPLAKRTGGYQGKANFCHLVTNLTIALDHGESACHDNIMALRSNDTGVTINVYGTANIDNNIFNGIDVTDHNLGTQAPKGIVITMNELGKAYYNIRGNSTNRKFSGPLIEVDNTAALKANRRLKVLSIKNNEALNYYTGSVLFTNPGSKASVGVELIYCEGNTFDGVASEFSIANVNGAAFSSTISTESTDTYYIRRNIVRSFYNIELCGSATVHSASNEGDTITASQNFNYLAPEYQSREMKVVVNPTIPRVGTSNADMFSYTAKRVDTTSGLVLETAFGEIAGGSSIGIATPAGSEWYIDQLHTANKGLG